MKTTVLKFFTLSVAIFAFSTISFGQNTSTASDVPVGATIITPLTITLSAGTQLQFGTIVADATSAVDVILSPDNAITTTLTHLGENSVPTFDVTGEPLSAYSVTFPLGTLTLTHDDSGTLAGTTTVLTVDTFTSNSTGTLSSTGEGSFQVGATLKVLANQAGGVYTGEFDVTVNYN
jgi:hypothetical protein